MDIFIESILIIFVVLFSQNVAQNGTSLDDEQGNFCGQKTYHCGHGSWKCCGPMARICCGPGPEFVCCYGNTACCFGGETNSTISWLVWGFSGALAFIVFVCCCVCCVVWRRCKGNKRGGGGGADSDGPGDGNNKNITPVNDDVTPEPVITKTYVDEDGDDMIPKRLALPPCAPSAPYNTNYPEQPTVGNTTRSSLFPDVPNSINANERQPLLAGRW